MTERERIQKNYEKIKRKYPELTDENEIKRLSVKYDRLRYLSQVGIYLGASVLFGVAYIFLSKTKFGDSAAYCLIGCIAMIVGAVKDIIKFVNAAKAYEDKVSYVSRNTIDKNTFLSKYQTKLRDFTEFYIIKTRLYDKEDEWDSYAETTDYRLKFKLRDGGSVCSIKVKKSRYERAYINNPFFVVITPTGEKFFELIAAYDAAEYNLAPDMYPHLLNEQQYEDMLKDEEEEECVTVSEQPVSEPAAQDYTTDIPVEKQSGPEPSATPKTKKNGSACKVLIVSLCLLFGFPVAFLAHAFKSGVYVGLGLLPDFEITDSFAMFILLIGPISLGVYLLFLIVKWLLDSYNNREKGCDRCKSPRQMFPACKGILNLSDKAIMNQSNPFIGKMLLSILVVVAPVAVAIPVADIFFEFDLAIFIGLFGGILAGSMIMHYTLGQSLELCIDFYNAKKVLTAEKEHKNVYFLIPRITMFFLIVVGLLVGLISSFAYTRMEYVKARDFGSEVEAVCYDIEEYEDDEGDTNYRFFYKYTYLDSEYEYKNTKSSKFLEIGDSFNGYVHPDNPEKFIQPWSNNSEIIYILFGIFFALIAFIDGITYYRIDMPIMLMLAEGVLGISIGIVIQSKGDMIFGIITLFIGIICTVALVKKSKKGQGLVDM